MTQELGSIKECDAILNGSVACNRGFVNEAEASLSIYERSGKKYLEPLHGVG